MSCVYGIGAGDGSDKSVIDRRVELIQGKSLKCLNRNSDVKSRAKPE